MPSTGQPILIGHTGEFKQTGDCRCCVVATVHLGNPLQGLRKRQLPWSGQLSGQTEKHVWQFAEYLSRFVKVSTGNTAFHGWI